MKTKWGSSSPSRRTVRLNLELAKFAPECLDYVALHEVAHFLAPDHGMEFLAILDGHMPGWRDIKNRLNEEPLPVIH
jgi:predicted metal-dependent hydrolase